MLLGFDVLFDHKDIPEKAKGERSINDDNFDVFDFLESIT